MDKKEKSLKMDKTGCILDELKEIEKTYPIKAEDNLEYRITYTTGGLHYYLLLEKGGLPAFFSYFSAIHIKNGR